MGGAVAVVLVGVVVAALGPEEEGGQDEETAAANQDRGKGEAVGVHRRGRADGLSLGSMARLGVISKQFVIGWLSAWWAQPPGAPKAIAGHYLPSCRDGHPCANWLIS